MKNCNLPWRITILKRYLSRKQPRSQDLSSSRPLERERERDGSLSLSRSRRREEERPWERGCCASRDGSCSIEDQYRKHNAPKIKGINMGFNKLRAPPENVWGWKMSNWTSVILNSLGVSFNFPLLVFVDYWLFIFPDSPSPNIHHKCWIFKRTRKINTLLWT